MARNIITTITDDIDGSPDAFGVTFALNGTAYEIDLAPKNADKLVKALAPFIEHARKASKAKASTTTARVSNKDDVGTVTIDGTEHVYSKAGFKDWAKANNKTLARGRRDPEMVADYLKSTK